ncbi:uncharacterized protein LOC109599508 [Aethina tumida]|uniref:uncharacterized protein LOC109599508 n=1 Tax=Aethina tumida TaxID=116153 RepID=UPI002147A546|nr:uncharacterized protein LOC109599508 [Aethina tumida]
MERVSSDGSERGVPGLRWDAVSAINPRETQLRSVVIDLIKSYKNVVDIYSQPTQDYTKLKLLIETCIDATYKVETNGNSRSVKDDITQIRFSLKKILAKVISATNERLLNKNIESTSIVLSDYIVKPNKVTFQCLGGLEEAKSILTTIVLLPKNQPQLFLDRKLMNAVLLFGPPGTGKTKLAYAAAGEAHCPLYTISSADLLSAYIGVTEKKLKDLFTAIKTQKKFSILFIDEIDGLLRHRDSKEQEYSRRLKTEFMCELNKMEDCKNTILICATNCPWDLDTAILRRFQKKIYIALPTREERIEHMRLHLKNADIRLIDSQWDSVLDETEYFSGSDIQNLVQSALHIPLNELVNVCLWRQCPDGFYEPATDQFNNNNVMSYLSQLPPNKVRCRKVTGKDFMDALNKANVKKKPENLKMYEDFASKLM